LATTEVYVQYQVTEPLLLSPFVFGSQEGKQGFYGIQTMNFQMNITANASRAWRSAREDPAGNYVKRATVDSFSNSQLIFTFLTPHASDMLEPRNVVPFYELPLYRTVGNNAVERRAMQRSGFRTPRASWWSPLGRPSRAATYS
jgi:hypothetical protein